MNFLLFLCSNIQVVLVFLFWNEWWKQRVCKIFLFFNFSSKKRKRRKMKRIDLNENGKKKILENDIFKQKRWKWHLLHGIRIWEREPKLLSKRIQYMPMRTRAHRFWWIGGCRNIFVWLSEIYTLFHPVIAIYCLYSQFICFISTLLVQSSITCYNSPLKESSPKGGDRNPLINYCLTKKKWKEMNAFNSIRSNDKSLKFRMCHEPILFPNSIIELMGRVLEFMHN